MREGNIHRPTIFDHVTEEMTCGREEIFGPVLCVKRVNSFEEGLQLMNNNRFANGSVIYTENGYFAREFVRRTDGGMVASMLVFQFRWRYLDSPGTSSRSSATFTAWGATASSSTPRPRM